MEGEVSLHQCPLTQGAAYRLQEAIMRGQPNSKTRVVGANGHYYVEETRYSKRSGGEEIVMHGRRPRPRAKPKPRIIKQ